MGTKDGGWTGADGVGISGSNTRRSGGGFLASGSNILQRLFHHAPELSHVQIDAMLRLRLRDWLGSGLRLGSGQVRVDYRLTGTSGAGAGAWPGISAPSIVALCSIKPLTESTRRVGSSAIRLAFKLPSLGLAGDAEEPLELGLDDSVWSA